MRVLRRAEADQAPRQYRRRKVARLPSRLDYASPDVGGRTETSRRHAGNDPSVDRHRARKRYHRRSGSGARRPVSQLKPPITIGLVNNMPDAALLATERQFLRLIEPISEAHDVHLRLFYLPEVARGDVARMQISARYAPIDALP